MSVFNGFIRGLYAQSAPIDYDRPLRITLINNRGETIVCDQKSEARPDIYVAGNTFGMEAERPKRSKFRPFGGLAQRHEEGALPPPGFGKEKSDVFEIVDLLATQLALRIEGERKEQAKRGRLDARTEREFDLAQTHLEDCVMRLKRGITS